MSSRDNGDKEKVQAATDLVRLIGEQLQLRPKGREFAGLCPFHPDKTPSMQVSPQKQIYKCFSCGAGGDAFSFVMNYHKMGFIEALKYLADRAGIELTPWKPEGSRGRGAEGSSEGTSGGERKRLAIANQQAVDFYKAMLRHGEHGVAGRAYLERRGISAEMIDTFGLGYAPDRWDGLSTMVGHKNWHTPTFVKAGLLKVRGANKAAQDYDPTSQDTEASDPDPRSPLPDPRPADCYDFLRHRLVFPIFDSIGRPIAFGGRKLRDEDEPKYLNSPESPLFHKSATLYGLHAAKKPIIDSKTAVIVEGYTDVIACHQGGATNVVAALGTALTPEHVRELRRYCEQVILVMDGDAAGQKAADRAIQVFLTGDLDVSIAVIPPEAGYKDPDELFKAGGIEAWQKVLAGAVDALTFAFSRVQTKMEAATTITGLQRVVEGYLNELADLGLDSPPPGNASGGGVRRALVLQRLAAMLHLPESEIDRLLKARTPRPRNNPRPRPRDTDPGTGGTGPPWNTRGHAPAGDDFSRAVTDAGAMADSVGPDSTGNAEIPPDYTPGDGPDDAVENGPSTRVAFGQSRSRLQAVGKAERRLIAALVRQNNLFHATLPDGSSIDEAISPAELAHAEHRALYQRVYDALAEGRPLSLPILLGDLASEGQHALIQLATTADYELDQTLPPPILTLTQARPDHPSDANADQTRPPPPSVGLESDDPDALRRSLLDAAQSILNFVREDQYQQNRQDFMRAAGDTLAADHPDHQSRLRQLIEHRKAHPSPTRIARPRT